MKLLSVFLLGALALGADSFNIEELEGQFILSATSTIEAFLAPLETVQNDLFEIYGQTKSNYKTKGYFLQSTDDCLALSNTTQIAYNLASTATQLALSSVKEITSTLNDVVNCPNTSIAPWTVIECMYDKIKTVQQEILRTEAKITPYKNEAVQLYSQMVSEMHACVGF